MRDENNTVALNFGAVLSVGLLGRALSVGQGGGAYAQAIPAVLCEEGG